MMFQSYGMMSNEAIQEQIDVIRKVGAELRTKSKEEVIQFLTEAGIIRDEEPTENEITNDLSTK